MPSLIYFALGLFLSLVTLFLAVMVAIGERERDLASRRLLAAAHADVELYALGAKTVLVVVASTLETFGRVQAVILAATSFYLVYLYLRGVSVLCFGAVKLDFMPQYFTSLLYLNLFIIFSALAHQTLEI